VIRVSCEGYQDEHRTITLTRATTERFVLSPLFLDLVIWTDPAEAQVYLDGEYKGATQADGRLIIPQVQAGQHTVRSRRKGYLDDEQVVKLLPENTTVRATLSPDPVWQRIQAIELAVKAGRLIEGFDLYEQLRREQPKHPDVSGALDVLMQELRTRTQDITAQTGVFGLPTTAEQAEEMRRLYDQARRWQPDDTTIELLAHYWSVKYFDTRAQQSTSLAERDHCLENLQLELAKVHQLNPSDAHILYDLGWHSVRQNDRASAERYFLKAREQNRTWVLPTYALAKLGLEAADQERDKKKRQQKYQQIIADLSQAIKNDSQFPYAYIERCIAYAKLGNHREAIADGRNAVALAPQSASAHYALGFAYYQRGKSEYANAQRELEQALVSKVDELNEVMRQLVEQWLGEIKKGKK
jgi:tetratricopeptide (TPR) repeat protein